MYVCVCVSNKCHSVFRVANYRNRGNAITMTRQTFGKCTRVRMFAKENTSLIVQCKIIGAVVKYEICGNVALMLTCVPLTSGETTVQLRYTCGSTLVTDGN
jgi:hypothetical protein